MSARRLKKSEQLSPPSRYELLARLAAGGMGAVYVGRSLEAESMALVAIKRAHDHLLEDPTFREMFVAEARLASRIRHPQVVGVRDVDESDGELLLVMDYVEGASFADLLSASQKQGRRLPHAVGVRIVLDAARGLHAAHSIRDESGRLLGMVHRDVSPHNILVGLDGTSRIVDFGVAKAIDHEGTNTQSGVLKGKAAYMAPEYLQGRRASPQSDIFSLGVVGWEGLASRRLFRADDEIETMQRILDPSPAPRLSDVVSVDAEIDAIVARALEKDRLKRYATADDFADALEAAARDLDLIAAPAEVGALVESLVGENLTATRTIVREAIQASRERIGRRRAVEETKTAFVLPSESAPTARVPPPGAHLRSTVAMPVLPPSIEQEPPSFRASSPQLYVASSPAMTAPALVSATPTPSMAPMRDSIPGPPAAPTIVSNRERVVPFATVALPPSEAMSAAVNATLQSAENNARTLRGTLLHNGQNGQNGSAPLMFTPTPAQLHRAPPAQSFTDTTHTTKTTSTTKTIATIAVTLMLAAGGTAVWAMTRAQARSATTSSAKASSNVVPTPSATEAISAPRVDAPSEAPTKPSSTVDVEPASSVPDVGTASAAPSAPKVDGSVAPKPALSGAISKPSPTKPSPSPFRPPSNPYH